MQDALLSSATIRTYTAGQRLFVRGGAPSGIFCMLNGMARIMGTAASGKEALLTLAEPPSWIGEISVFDRQPRTHDAVAIDGTEALHVPQEALDAILAKEPRYWRDLALLLTGKLRLMFHFAEDIALNALPARLAKRLTWMAEGYGEWYDRKTRVVDVKQEQLAMMLSTSRQTVNQLLKDFETRGLIRLAYGQVEIVDLEGLRAMSMPEG